MPRTVTSDVSVDSQILRALGIPIVPATFEEVYNSAQSAITILSKSSLFRQFLKEKTDDAFRSIKTPYIPECLHLASAGTGHDEECLVLTNMGNLKFCRSDLLDGAHYLTFLNERDHDPRLMDITTTPLRRMTNAIDAMRFLLLRFGEPSFSCADIEKEMARNGKVNITVLTNYDCRNTDDHSLADTIALRLKSLQFGIESIAFDYNEIEPEALTAKDNEQKIIVIDCIPMDCDRIKLFYDGLNESVQKRVWLAAYNDNYIIHGFRGQIMTRPRLQTMCALDDTSLLAVLDQMFDD